VSEQARVLKLLQAHGWNATSFQILEPGFSYWFDGEDACVGYVDVGRGWVVAGAPIAAYERLAEVTRSFLAAANAAGKRVTCFATESRFHQAVGWHDLRIGDQPVWDSEDWTTTLERSRSLREQLRRARAKGVTVRLLAPEELASDHPTRAHTDALINRWLATRAMAPMGFLVQVHAHTFPEERQCFVAELDGRVVGFLGVIPIYARRGWFFEDFLSDPTAPNGTVETLIDAGMRAAAAGGVRYVTLGLVPLMGDIGRPLQAIRRWGAPLYDFDGLRAFKAKLRPRSWDPIYLSYPPGGTAWSAVLDTLKAFARGGLLGFGIRTLLRGPAIVMRALAVLLVPWTILLSLPVSRSWFPSEMVRWGWVVFDVVVAVALYRLSERWNSQVALLLTSFIALDAALTLLQAIFFDLPRFRTPPEVAIIAVAVLAPVLAATLLWTGRSHRRSIAGAD
jgi:phosphatidylglycerol lysyltransferase